MGRLIDADKLIILAENTFARPNGFIQLIEETETAYDVEKVVADLQKFSTIIEQNENSIKYAIEENMAVHIVKKGGVE